MMKIVPSNENDAKINMLRNEIRSTYKEMCYVMEKQLRNTYTSEIFSSAVLTVCSFVGLRFVFLFFQNRNICCRR